MAQSTSEVLQQLGAGPLPVDCRALLVMGEDTASFNSVHAICLVIVEGDTIKYVSDSDTYLDRTGRESRLVSTLEKLLNLGFRAPTVVVEKGEKIVRLRPGRPTGFMCPSLSALAAMGRMADARYWSDVEAGYEAALRLARENHEKAKAAVNLPA